MRKLILFTFGLLLYSCMSNVQPKEVTKKYPKEYIIVVRYTDNVVDTINYISRDSSEVIFTIRNVEPQFINKDVPIKPTLIAGFKHDYETLVENVAVDIKSYKIIKEIY